MTKIDLGVKPVVWDAGFTRGWHLASNDHSFWSLYSNMGETQRWKSKSWQTSKWWWSEEKLRDKWRDVDIFALVHVNQSHLINYNLFDFDLYKNVEIIEGRVFQSFL